uniref:Omp-1-5 n=1 Tax=Ehrlichia ewingii TaxID=947 RepID=B1N6A8_9RICK|nr:Omp-1-5 [Ehrlichia ewingii]
MNNKKSHVICMLIFLLLPMKSFSVLIDTTEKDYASNVYISSQYKPSFSNFRSFSIQEINSKTKNSIALEKPIESNSNILKSNAHIIVPHNIQFQDNTISFSGAVGYSSKGLRLELESAYEEFYTKELNSSSLISSNNHYTQLYEANFQNFATSRLSITSFIINTCYDILIGSSPVMPYICTGIGGDIIRLFNTTYLKFAYQGKFGISYPLNNNIILFSDIYYHEIIGQEFENLYTQYVSGINSLQEITSVPASFNIGYFGSEIGVRFIFNKQ